MPGSTCLNCGEVFNSQQKFCSFCGQKTDTQRITAKQLGREFFQTITNFDKGIWHLLKGLATHPGSVLINYIQGKRKQYFNPFAFLAMCIAVSLFINNALGSYQSLPAPDYSNIGGMPSEHLQELAETAKIRAARVQEFVNRNLNFLTVFITPYVAFMLWIFFRKRKRNLPEIAIAYILLSAFGILISTILIYPFMLIFTSYFAFNVLIWISTLLQMLYYSWGLKYFFGYKTAGGFLKVAGALILIGLLGMIVVMIFIFLYVYSGTFELLYYLKPNPS